MIVIDKFKGLWFTKWDEEQQLRIVEHNEISWYVWDPQEQTYKPVGDANVYEKGFHNRHRTEELKQ